MEVRLVFTKMEASFISRAIMWFSPNKKHPERDCAHVIVKFKPQGIFEEAWAGFEAMERGVWLDFYEDALGKSTLVAEFKLKAPEGMVYEALRETLKEYLGAQYDYAGIALFAERILASRWFASIVKWFHIKFRPKAVHAKFCSGLALVVIKKIQDMNPEIDWGVDGMKPRTTSPRALIDLCFGRKALYKFIGGIAGGE